MATPHDLLVKPAGMSQWEWAMVVRGRGYTEAMKYAEAMKARARATSAPAPIAQSAPATTEPSWHPIETQGGTVDVTPTTPPETPAAVHLKAATDISNQLIAAGFGGYWTPEMVEAQLFHEGSLRFAPQASGLTVTGAGVVTITGPTGVMTINLSDFNTQMKEYETAYAKYAIEQVTQITSQALKAFGQQNLVSKALGPEGVALLTSKLTIEQQVAQFNANYQRGVFPGGVGGVILPATATALAQAHLQGVLDQITSADFGDYFAYQKIAAVQKGVVWPSDLPKPTNVYYKEGAQEVLRPQTTAQVFEAAEARLNDYLLHGTSLSYRLGEAFDVPVIRDIVRGFMGGAEDIANIAPAITGVTLPQPVSKTGGFVFESPVGVPGVSVTQPSQLETLARYAGQMVAFQGIFTAGRVIAGAVSEGATLAIRETGAGVARLAGAPSGTVSAMREIADVYVGGAKLGFKWTFIGQPITRYWGEMAITSYEGGLLAPFIEPWPWSVIKEVPTFTPDEILRNPQLSKYLFNQPSIGAKIDMSAYELIRPAGLIETTTVAEKIAGTNLAFDERLGGYFKVPAGGESGLFVTTTEKFAALEKSVFVERGTLDRILNFQLESGQFGITAPYTTPLKLSLKTDIGTLETIMKPMIEITEVSQREVFNLGNVAIAKTTRWYPIAPEGVGDLIDIGWISRQDLLATYRSKSWIDLEFIRDQTKFLGSQPVLDLTKTVAPGAIPPSLGKTVYTLSRTDLSILDMAKEFARIESDTLGFGATEYVSKPITMIKPDWSLRIGGETHTPWAFPSYDALQEVERIFPSVAKEMPTTSGVSLAETITKITRGLNQIVFEEAPIVFPAVESASRDIIASGAMRVSGTGILLGVFPTIKLGAMSNIGAEMNKATQRDLSRIVQPIILRPSSVEEPTLKAKDVAKLLSFPTNDADTEAAQKTALATVQATIQKMTTPTTQITTPDFPDIPDVDFSIIIPPPDFTPAMFFPKKRRAKIGKKKYTERLWYVGPLMPKLPKLNIKATKMFKLPKSQKLKLPKMNTNQFKGIKMPNNLLTKRLIKTPRMKKMRRMV